MQQNMKYETKHFTFPHLKNSQFSNTLSMSQCQHSLYPSRHSHEIQLCHRYDNVCPEWLLL